MNWTNNLGMWHTTVEWDYSNVVLRISTQPTTHSVRLEVLSLSSGWVGLHNVTLPPTADTRDAVKECKDYARFLETLQPSDD